MALCPCGSGLDFEECCHPIIAGEVKASTAEKLMRARYSAHATRNYDFVASSCHPEFREEASPEENEKWSSLMEWEKLDINEVVAGSENDETGEVDFTAHYTVRGFPQEMREHAYFRRENDTWYYVDGDVYGREPVRRTEPKIGRNDPCPCGSGKKYKKCCMNKEAR